MREEYQRLRERIVKELESMSDPDKVQFLRSEITIIDQRLAGLEGGSSAHLQRWVLAPPLWRQRKVSLLNELICLHERFFVRKYEAK